MTTPRFQFCPEALTMLTWFLVSFSSKREKKRTSAHYYFLCSFFFFFTSCLFVQNIWEVDKLSHCVKSSSVWILSWSLLYISASSLIPLVGVSSRKGQKHLSSFWTLKKHLTRSSCSSYLKTTAVWDLWPDSWAAEWLLILSVPTCCSRGWKFELD